MKIVTITAHSFDSMPSHTFVVAQGKGTSLHVAAGRAMNKLFSDAKLKRRRISQCKLALIVQKGD